MSRGRTLWFLYLQTRDILNNSVNYKDINTSDDDDFVVGDFRLQGLKKSRNYGPTVCEVNYSNLFCY